jgi:rhodanese-related sulfurtransferase
VAAGRIFPTAIREALLIGGASILLAGALWLARPDRLPLRAQAEFYDLELAAPLVPVAEATAIFSAGTHLFVDSREDPTSGGISSAFRVRPSAFDADLAEVRDFLYPEDKLILYDDGTMQEANAAAVRFLERGYRNVTILQGGLAAWRTAGGPVEKEDPHAP